MLRGLRIVAEQEMKDRVGAVVPRDAAQAPKDVGDVAAEHAAVGVQLVDNDVLEPAEQVGPLDVVGQDAPRGACRGW